MAVGGQDSASVETNLQRGNELYEADPKTALAAYYQVVQTEPGHYEAWNQIGRLMFDMQQFAESKAIFQKVEMISRGQGLDDWADMAAQNADLAGQMHAQYGPPQTESAPAHEEARQQAEPGPSAAEEAPVAEIAVDPVSDIASVASGNGEENPSASISVIDQLAEAAAAETPKDDFAAELARVTASEEAEAGRLVAEAARKQAEATAPPAAAAPQQASDNVQAPENAQAPDQGSAPAAQTIETEEVGKPPAFLAHDPANAATQAVAPAPAQPATEAQKAAPLSPDQQIDPSQIEKLMQTQAPSPETPAQEEEGKAKSLQEALKAMQPPAIEQPAVPVPPTPVAQAAPPPPAAPAVETPQPTQPPRAAHPQPPEMPPVAMQPPVVGQPPVAAQHAQMPPQMPVAAHMQPPQMPHAGHNGAAMPQPPQSAQPQPPRMNANSAPPAGQVMVGGQVVETVGEPLPVTEQQPHPVDAEMDAPKSGRGKLAAAMLGVVGAVGIGGGAAWYLNQPSERAGGIPTIKSEEKVGAASSETERVAAAQPKRPSLPTPEQAGRDQAFKIGIGYLVKGDYDNGRAYLEKAASEGHAEASYNLASMYAKGDGVEQSFDKVIAYLNKAVDGGYYPAMTNLGLLYAQGQGVPQDYDKARELWQKAAEGEHPDAMHNLGVIYATGKGVGKDMKEAIKWYRKGTNAGFIDSMANLGLIYANGDGVPQDFNEAKRLWKMASAKGHKVAGQNLAKLEQIMAQQQKKTQ